MRSVDTALEVQLDTLDTAGLVVVAQRMPELEYLFRHALIQDAAYTSLLKNGRRALHLKIGRILESAYADRPAEAAPVLAHHFYQAGDDARALHYLTMAGDEAARKYANSEAVMHYARALEIAVRTSAEGLAGDKSLLHLFIQRGRALELSGQHQEALSSYAEMEALAINRGDHELELAALLQRATIYSLPTPAHDSERGQALNEQSIALARERHDLASEAKAYWNLMVLGIFSGGEPQQTVAYGERSLALARQLDLREQIAYTLTDLYMAYFNLGKTEQAQAALAESRGLWQSQGNLPMLADCLARTAHAQLCAGVYDQAIMTVGEVCRVSRAAQAPWQEANGRQIEAFIYLDRGDTAMAIQCLREIIAIADRIGLLPVQTGSRADLGLLYAQCGQFETGRALAVEACTHAAQMTPMLAWSQAALARIELCAGHPADAEKYVELAWPGYALLLQGLSVLVPAWAEIALARAEVQYARAEYGAAVKTMDELLAALRAHGVQPFAHNAHYLKGMALLALARWAEAAQSLAAGRAEAEAIGAASVLWKILMAERRLVLRSDDEAEAKQLLDAARKIIQELAARAPDGALRASFLAQPEVMDALHD